MPTTKHTLRTGLAVLAAAAVPALAQPIAASAAPSAHFRVVATGFDVKTPTYDTIFQTDGKCDEVFLNYQTYRLTASGTSLYDSAHSSDTMGDINGQAGRIKAGSCSDQGGLRANDAFPSRNPWIETVPPAIDRNYPSMKIWEGDLVQGQDVALITPSLWEYDGNSANAGPWLKWGADTAKALAPVAGQFLGPGAQAIMGGVQVGLEAAVAMNDAGLMGDAYDRPIGMTKAADGKTYEFKPKVLPLNYDNATTIAREDPSGLGQGVLGWNFADAKEIGGGSYGLYLRVEKMRDNPPTTTPPATTPSPTPSPAPTTTPAPAPEPADPIESPLCRRKPWLCG